MMLASSLLPGTAAASVDDSIPATGTIVGVVRGGVSGLPLAGARVVFRSGYTETETSSDSAGSYCLRDVAAGIGDLIVALGGYDSLALQVTVPGHGIVHVDVALARHRVSLAPVRVVVPAVNPPVVLSPTPTAGSVDTAGDWHWTGDVARNAYATGEPDAFRMLTGDPNINMRPDWPASVMDRGGDGDQLLTVLDGLPIWNPVHAGGVLSAVSPDVIAAITLHDGAIPARYGGRLAGVLAIQPRPAPAETTTTAGVAVGPAASRTVWSVPVHAGSMSGGSLIALRRSNADLFGRDRRGAFIDRWADGTGTLSLLRGATSVRALALLSRDQLGVVRPEPTVTTAGTEATEDTGKTPAQSPASLNPVTPPTSWETRTLGVVWTQRVAPAAQVETRVWHASFRASVYQQVDSIPSTLASSVRHVGVASQLTRGNTTVGMSLEQLALRYAVTSAATDTTSRTAPPFDLRTTPAVITTFVERRWGGSDGRWRAAAGFRATEVLIAHSQARVLSEPRFSLSGRIGPGVTVTAGYARTHQYIQSLRNPESPLGTVVGVDFPVAAGEDGVPIAQSDAGTIGVTARLAPTISLAFDAYVRALSGLTVASPGATTLFAIQRFEVVSGRVSGIGVALSGRERRLAWHASYGMGTTVYTAGSGGYHPSSELGRAATASLTLQLDRRTQLRTVGWTATGPQGVRLDQVGAGGGEGALPGEDGVERETETTAELSHSSYSEFQQALLDQSHLPPYARADLSLIHDWSTGPGRGHGRFSVFLTLANMFGHTNIAAYVPRPAVASNGNNSGATPRPITLTPRSLRGGASWWY